MADERRTGGYLAENPFALLVVMAVIFVATVAGTVWMFTDWPGFKAEFAGDEDGRVEILRILGPIGCVLFTFTLVATWGRYRAHRRAEAVARSSRPHVAAAEHPRFPAGWRLRLGMLAAFAVGAACTIALAGAIVWLALVSTMWWFFFAFCFLVIGLDGMGRRSRPADEAEVSDQRARVEQHLERLCLQAGWVPPAVVIEDDEAPQLWTTALARRRAKIHVTVGFTKAATDEELAAALGHELAHIAHGDAVVMTLVGGPPTWILAGLRHSIRTSSWRHFVGMLILGLPFAVFALPGRLAASALSRQRELGADYGAATVTGSPAQVAATLVRFSRELNTRRHTDVRAAGAGDLFYFVPTGPERRGIARLWASHPRLEVRLERLEEMERALQAA